MHLIKSEIRRFSKPGTKINLFNWHFKWSICCNRNNRYWLDKTTPIRLFFFSFDINRTKIHTYPLNDIVYTRFQVQPKILTIGSQQILTIENQSFNFDRINTVTSNISCRCLFELTESSKKSSNSHTMSHFKPVES